MQKKIKCVKTLDIINRALVVGYIDSKSKRKFTSDVGTPQGSVLSPLLANIVLHELDNHVNEVLLPKYHKGKRRRTNPEYNKYAHIRATKKDASEEERKTALKMKLKTPRMDNYDHHQHHDPEFRRSMYIRFAYDFVFLLEGPRSEAVSIKEEIKSVLKEKTGLELNDEKTLITPIKDGFHFLGAHIKTLRHVDFRMKRKTVKGKSITMRANVRARVNIPPTKRITDKLIKTKFARRSKHGLILARPVTKKVNLDHSTIIQNYNSKIHGLLNYYSFAANRVKLQNII